MLGLIAFIVKQRKRRFGTKCHINGPLYMTIVAAFLIMMEPSRHALQDTGAWPESKVTHLKDVTGVGLALDSSRGVLLLPDTQIIGSSMYDDEKLFRVHRLQYSDGEVSGELPMIENLTSSPTAIHWDKTTDAYYIGLSDGYVAKYEPTTGKINNTWCKLIKQGEDVLPAFGMDSDENTLFVAGGTANVIYKCRLFDGQLLEQIGCGMFSNTSSINDVAYDSSSHTLFATFSNSPIPDDENRTDSNSTTPTPPSGVLQVHVSSGAVSHIIGDGDRGINNANKIMLDDKWIVVTTYPGTRIYNIEKNSKAIKSYSDISAFTKPNIRGLSMVESGNYILETNTSELVVFDFNFFGSGQYVHNPSRNCISSNNEKMRCLTALGVFTTIVCTYLGFVLLAVGTMWNANLVSKLKDARDKWRELRS